MDANSIKNTPTANPANDNDLPGTMLEVLRAFLMNVDDMLPVEVVSYDRATNRATVKHFIQSVETGGDNKDKASIISCPTLYLGSGGFSITFNISEGNKGWIKASDRDLSAFLEAYDKQPPESARIHVFDNGIFIPDVMEALNVAAEDETAMLISNDDGSTKISLSAARLKIKHGTLIVHEGKTNLGTGSVKAIARVGDECEMTFATGVFGATASGIQIPASETTLTTCLVNTGSVNNFAD